MTGVITRKQKQVEKAFYIFAMRWSQPPGHYLLLSPTLSTWNWKYSTTFYYCTSEKRKRIFAPISPRNTSAAVRTLNWTEFFCFQRSERSWARGADEQILISVLFNSGFSLPYAERGALFLMCLSLCFQFRFFVYSTFNSRSPILPLEQLNTLNMCFSSSSPPRGFSSLFLRQAEIFLGTRS